MFDGFNELPITEEERQIVQKKFPTPIATPCAKLWRVMESASSKKEMLQRSSVELSLAFESLLRFCAWTVTSDYLEQQKEWADPALDRAILEFLDSNRRHGRNKIGNWRGLFGTVMFGLLDHSRPLFVKEAAGLKDSEGRQNRNEPKDPVKRWFAKRLERLGQLRNIVIHKEQKNEQKLENLNESLCLFHEILKDISFFTNYRLLVTLRPVAGAPETFAAIVFQGIDASRQVDMKLRRQDRELPIEGNMTYLVNNANCALRLTPLFAYIPETQSVCTFVEAMGPDKFIYSPDEVQLKDEKTVGLISHIIRLMEYRDEKWRTQKALEDATVACRENCDEFLRWKRPVFGHTLYQHREVQEIITSFLENGQTLSGEPLTERVMVVVGPSGVGKSTLMLDVLANRPNESLSLAYYAKDIRGNIQTAIMKSLGMSGESHLKALIDRLDRFRRERPEVLSEETPMVIFIDGLNEADDYKEIFQSIHELALSIGDCPIRILLTTRPDTWRRIEHQWNRNGQFQGIYYQPHSENSDTLPYSLALKPFSMEELREIYERHRSQNGSYLPTFDELAHEWKVLLRSPFYLSVVAGQAKEEGGLSDFVSPARTIRDYIRIRLEEERDQGISVSGVQEVLVKLAEFMLKYHCLIIRCPSRRDTHDQLLYSILESFAEPYAIAIDAGIIEERGRRTRTFEIHFTHDTFKEYYFAEALRSELDKVSGTPNERAQIWVKRMVGLLENAHMGPVLYGAFSMLISSLQDNVFLEQLLWSLARHDAPEVRNVVVESLVQLCEQNWAESQVILQLLMGGGSPRRRFILSKVVTSLRSIVARGAVTQEPTLSVANMDMRCRLAAIEAATLVKGNRPNRFLIDVLQDRSGTIRNVATDLVSRRWCDCGNAEREAFVEDLASALKFPKVGSAGTLWHAFKKRHLLQSSARFLFNSYVEDVRNADRVSDILNCCQLIMGNIRPDLLPRLSTLLVRPAFFIIRRFSLFPLKSIAILWDKVNVDQTFWLVKFIDPCVYPTQDELQRIDQILMTGGRDEMQFGKRWTAIVAYSGYAANKPDEAARHFKQLHERGDEFARYFLLVPATAGWVCNRSFALRTFVEDTCWRIMTDWQQEIYLAEKPWFTCGMPVMPLGLFSWRVAEEPSAPLSIFRKAMEEFYSKQKNPLMTGRLLLDVAPLFLTCPNVVLPILLQYPELLDPARAAANEGSEEQWNHVVTHFCELLATLRLSNPRVLEYFLEMAQPPVSFIAKFQHMVPNSDYLKMSYNLRLGVSTQRLLFATPNDISHWFICSLQAIRKEGSMHKHVAHLIADMLACLQFGSLKDSDFMNYH